MQKATAQVLTKKPILLDVLPKEWKVSSVAPIPKAIEAN
jgi:hypothetical protein